MTAARVVQVVGARPQFIKLAPVSRALRHAALGQITELIVHTGQHYDAQLSEVFFAELDIPRAAANLEVGSGSHAAQTATMLQRLETYLLDERPAAVVVYGDTNSTLAGALAAAKLHIPVVHIEAGLRSFNRRMPEELNRVATDHLSERLLAPTEVALQNLAREGLASRTQLVGDVMYDALLANVALARQRSTILERLKLGTDDFGLVTVHRAESTEPTALDKLLSVLAVLAETCLPLLFPMHPRTHAAIAHSLPQWRASPALTLIEPLGPLDMLRATEAAAVIITDSGGLQKEAFMLGRPCVTLRGETEWLETLAAGANTLVGHDLEQARAAVQQALRRGRQSYEAAIRQAGSVYGEGRAAERCAASILELVHRS